MSTKPVNVGIVGLSTAGWASYSHLPALASPTASNAVRLTALSTTSAKSAAAAAQNASKLVGHEVKGYFDASELAKDEDVDVVAISVSVLAHEAAVNAALDPMGHKDLFVEWPAGGDLETATRLRDQLKEKDGRSIIGLQGRFSPVAMKVKEIVESGKLGTIRSTLISSVFGREFEFGGPVISDRALYIVDPATGNKASVLSIGVGHTLDTVQHALSFSLTSLTATALIAYPTAQVVSASTHQPTGQTVKTTTADHIAISAQADTGALVSVIFRSGYKAQKGRKTLVWEVDGEEGVLRVEGEALDSAMLNVASVSGLSVTLNGEKVEVEETEGGGVVHNVAQMWTDYARARDVHSKGHYATMDDAVKLHRVLNAVEVSAKEGRRVNL